MSTSCIGTVSPEADLPSWSNTGKEAASSVAVRVHEVAKDFILSHVGLTTIAAEGVFPHQPCEPETGLNGGCDRMRRAFSGSFQVRYANRHGNRILRRRISASCSSKIIVKFPSAWAAASQRPDFPWNTPITEPMV
jgi:hypothetical protein